MTPTTVDRHFTRRGHGAEFDMEVDWLRRYLPANLGELPNREQPPKYNQSPNHCRVLDVGCGIGALFDVYGRDRVVGIDLMPEGLALTRRRYPHVALACADARRLPFADGSFDIVASQHVVEHLPDYEQALGEWFRVLQPGGIAMLLTPNRRFCDPSVYDDDTHVHIFAENDLSQVIRDAGFSIIDVRSLGLPWFRDYARWPGTWRLRRFVTRRAGGLSQIPGCRWRGQTLCCAAWRPVDS